MAVTSHSADSKVKERWLLRIASADATKETEFDLSVALSGQDDGDSGLTFGTETTPYEREFTADMVLIVAASRSSTRLNSEFRHLDGSGGGVSVSSLRQILGKQVFHKIDCFGRGF
ncbi:hypothetical protein HYR99_19510 [Candidatus Poribacteria bacterium]|nr:hypothetical protein [Candidatus Poribacteria bacterium]